MAGMTGTYNANVSARTDIIDLTLSDDENASPQLTAPHLSQLSEALASDSSDEDLPEHGLLLDRDFGSFKPWKPSLTTSVYKHKLLKGKFSRLHRRTTSKTPQTSNEHDEIPPIRQINDYHSSSAKRRRVELDPTRRNPDGDDIAHILHKSQIDLTYKKGRTSLPSPAQPSSAQALPASRLGQGGKELSKDVTNESFKIALRQQIFPHVNQRLGDYKLSIDNATRRQLGKKIAWEICGEDFMNDLMQNDGRLSAAFEMKAASITQSLVDRYATKFVKDFTKGQHVPEGPKHRPLLKEGPKTDPQHHHQQRRSLGDSSEMAKTIKNAKLSASMKDRWARGGMDAARSKRAATLLLKKAAQKKSQYDHGHANLRERETTRRSDKLTNSLTPLNLSDDDNFAEQPQRRLIVTLRIGKRSAQNIADGFHALQPRPCILESDGSHHEPRLSIRHPVRKAPKAAALVMHPPSSSLEPQGRIRYQNAQKLAAFARPSKSLLQMENLRLSGLDHQLSRPYVSWEHRNDIERGIALMQMNQKHNKKFSEADIQGLDGLLLHVDFSQEEIEYMIPAVEAHISSTALPKIISSRQGIEGLMEGRANIIPDIVTALCTTARVPGGAFVLNRTESAVAAFLQDAVGRVSSTRPKIKRLRIRANASANSVISPDSVMSLLRQRESLGRRRNERACLSFKARLLNDIEDDYIRKAEWIDSSGDIATITWIDDDRFFCGATTHSDEHNMQYNKPGNLLVGASMERALKSVPGHQIVRPIVTKGDNSLEAMRGTQDPWMYCSVTSTAYSHDNRKCFTGSYDQTVKVWGIAEDGSSMDLCGTWSHCGNVNFVVASPNHGLVATAADVREDAVRVYHFDSENITASAFSIYEASVQRHNSSDTWAYFPSTMQWGISPSVSHLLLVGYSPRSFTCQDDDIPEDRLNSGELCLWDSRDGSRIPITSARTQNVFEVAWHPTQPIFVAATSPAGTFEDWVRTQLRVFEQRACGSFSHVKTLDCPAIDINEITIMPNSRVNSYVTASCTDGNTYVWDSALSDKPLHVLRHGNSIDEYSHHGTREETDIGVKFAAWGSNLDRFYTGSSDGVVKAWNVRAPPGHELVRDIIKLSGGVSVGKFSQNFSKLVIGDSTGKVHLLALDQVEPSEEVPMTLRKPITPHPPLPAPLIDDDDIEIPPEQTAREIGQEFLDRQQIIIHEDQWIGAIQGPNYASTGLLYNIEEYKDEFGIDSEGWSIEELKEKQELRYSVESVKLTLLPDLQSSNQLLHEKNLALDLDATSLSPRTYNALKKAGVDLRFQDENAFEFELGPLLDVEKERKGLLSQEQLLNDYEIRELSTLKQQISYELKVQKGLKRLL